MNSFSRLYLQPFEIRHYCYMFFLLRDFVSQIALRTYTRNDVYENYDCMVIA